MSHQKFSFFFQSILRSVSLVLVCTLASVSPGQAFWVWSPETGKFVNPEGAVQDTPDDQYRYAMAVYGEGDREQAIKELEHLLKHYPGAQIAPEVQLKLTILLEEAQEFKKAFENYKSLLKNYPQFEQADEVIRREYDLGHIFLNGLRRKVMGVPILPSVPLAVEVFQHIVDTAPFSAYGSQAQFYLGEALRKLGRFEESVKAFQAVSEIYPQSDLASGAKFQAAETQLIMSSTVNRDQQGLAAARQQFEDFLKTNPNADEVEKATVFKRQAEEQHARKNFDIGSYYEERSYLDSAIIYYETVANLYPDTEWGKKATARLEQLKNPVRYWESESEKTGQELTQWMAKLDEATSRLASLSDTVTEEERSRLEAERKEIGKTVKQLREKESGIKKAKRDDIERRRDLLSRKKRELSSKRDAINRKKKKLKHVESEDLKRAFAQWDEALKLEAGSLERERVRLDRLADEVGVKTEGLLLSVFPFVGGEELSETITYKKGEIEELDAQRAYLESRRNDLIDERESIKLQIEMLEMKQLEILSGKEELKQQWASEDGTLKQQKEDLEKLRQEIARLEREAKTLEERYRKAKGISIESILKAPLAAVTASVTASVNLLNPIPYLAGEGETADKLKAREEHLQAKLNRKEERLKEISSALNRGEDTKELTRSEEPTVSKQDAKGTTKKAAKDQSREIRKSTRKIEKDIRKVLQQVDDHRRIKNRKVDELEALLKQAEKEVPIVPGITRSVTKPFKAYGRLMHAFIFGLKEKEEFVQEDAGKLETVVPGEMQARIIALQEEIQFENVLIGAKRQELADLDRKLREVKENAAAAGAPSFQSLLVKQSYSWLSHTLSLAGKMVPNQDMNKILEKRFNRETAERDEILRGLEAVQAAQKKLLAKTESAPDSASEAPIASAPITVQPLVEIQTEAPAKPEAGQPDGTAAIENELKELMTKIEERRQSLETREQMFRKEIKSFYEANVDDELKEKFGRNEKALFTQDKNLAEKLGKVEKNLENNLEDEHALIQEERKLVVERLKKITDLTKAESLSDKNRKLIQEETIKLETHLKSLEAAPRLDQEGKVLAGGKEAL